MKRRKESRKGKRTRETHDPETLIPSALKEEISLADAEAGGGKVAKSAYASRKEERKRRRKEKRRAGHAATQQWRTRRRQQSTCAEDINEGDTIIPELIQDSTKDTAGASVPEKLKKVTDEKTKKRKRNSSNADGNEGEVAQNDAPRTANGVYENPDAREVRRLEKLLGVDRRKKRKAAKGKTFAYSDLFGEDEGDMVDLLDFCDKAVKSSGKNANTHDSESGSDREKVEIGSDSVGEVQQEELDSDYDEFEEVDMQDETELFSTANSRRLSYAGNASSAVESSSDASHPSQLENIKDKTVLLLEDAEELTMGRSAGKYIPPSARGQGNAKLRVTRRIRGLLNRVADANASSIADSIIQLYEADDGGVTRDELASVYVTTTLNAVRDGSGVGYINPYIESHAAIASHIGFRVDVSVLAMVVVSLVRRIDVELEKLQDTENVESIMAYEHSIQNDAFGYIVLLCALYERGSVACTMVYELVRTIAEPFTSQRLEILLVLLRQVGALLRQDDPTSLKDMIEFIHEQSRKGSNGPRSDEQDTPNMKLEIMLDLINDIKNNKIKKADILERKAKFAWAGAPAVPLSASFRNLLDDDFSSKRWWGRDGALHGEQQMKEFPASSANGSMLQTRTERNGEGEPDLASLASSLRLNTEYRKALFKAVMSSINVSDAFGRLERMSGFNTKNNHDRDTALVLLHCCGSEKDFNPFYALLAERMCMRSRKLRFTFEFALWDIFKSIPGTGKTAPMSKRKARNFGHLLAHLWNSGALSLSVLRCITDFEDLGDYEKSFFVDAVMMLTSKLAKVETEQPTAPFEKLCSENWNGVDAFRIALALFFRRSVQSLLQKAERSVLVKGFRILEGKNLD